MMIPNIYFHGILHTYPDIFIITDVLHKVFIFVDVLPVFTGFQKQYGNLFKIMLGNRARLVICDPKAAEFLLGSTSILEKSYEYKYLHSWLGTGLLTSSSK